MGSFRIHTNTIMEVEIDWNMRVMFNNDQRKVLAKATWKQKGYPNPTVDHSPGYTRLKFHF